MRNKTKQQLQVKDRCTHPQHRPTVIHMYIRPGESVDFKCPACGEVTTLHGNNIRS